MMARFRRISQVLFLLFFFVLFLRARYPYSAKLPGDLFLRFSPLLPLFHFIDNLNLPLLLWPAVLILLLTLFFGRFFCGWICPLGASLDIFNRLIHSSNKQISGRLRWIKFGLLGALILLAVFSLNLWGYVDPLSIFTRFTTVVFYPFFTLFTENALLTISNLPLAGPAAGWLYDFFKNVVMPESQAHHTEVFTVLILVLFIFGMEKISRRFWCRYLCPAGALLGFLSQFRLFGRTVHSSCIVCNRCQTNCRMNAIPEGNVFATNAVECIQCGSCAEQCPPRAKSITFQFHRLSRQGEPDISRRRFVESLAGGLATLGLFGLGISHKEANDRLIRPPGAVAEDEFLDRCIRCLECVRMCQSNGGCLQPGGLGNGLEQLWTPVAIMREGYCEYNCNLCGQVCPTDAILPLTLAEKQHTPMGLAYFDKNTCIPYAKFEDCLVCEEHCPTPDKAIKFDEREVQTPTGERRTVKFPYVVRELCIGCGICQTKCPLPGASAIFVTRENEKRLPPG